MRFKGAQSKETAVARRNSGINMGRNTRVFRNNYSKILTYDTRTIPGTGSGMSKFTMHHRPRKNNFFTRILILSQVIFLCPAIDPIDFSLTCITVCTWYYKIRVICIFLYSIAVEASIRSDDATQKATEPKTEPCRLRCRHSTSSRPN